MSAQLIKVNGEVVDVLTPVKLKDGQNFVGGLVEIVRVVVGPRDAQMLVNEEALIHNLKYNPVASGIAHLEIYGDVLILSDEHQWD